MEAQSALPGLLRDVAAVAPDQVAIAVDGVERLTYRAWRDRSENLAAGLQRRGVAPRDRVALVFDAPRWCDYAVAYLAVHQVGAVAVPLSAGAGHVPLARALRVHRPTVVVAPVGLAPAQGPAPLLPPGVLEAEGREHPPARTPTPPAPGEILSVARPLSQPVAIPRRPEDVLAPPPWLDDGAGPAALLHLFAPGSLLGQDTLRAALSAHPTASVVAPTFDADRLCAMLAGDRIPACALHPATAHALLESGATARHDLTGVDQVVLASGRTAPGLLTALARAFPRAALVGVEVSGDPPAVRAVGASDHDRRDAVGLATVRWVGDEAVRQERAMGTAGRGTRTEQTPTPVEKAVTNAWRRVLGVREVGLHDDFFALGGTTAAAAAMLALVEDACGVRLALEAVVDAPTVSGVAAEVARRASAAAAQPAPVAFSQEGMVWHEHFVPGCQNLPGLARRYRGPLDVDALARALDEIVRRHEPLRTTFALRDGRLLQTVRPHRRTDLPVRDLRDATPDQRDQEVARRVADAGQRPFDLTDDAVFTATLLRLAADDHVLVIRTHHSVFDDWSVGVFRRELAALYTAFAAGEPSPLPEPPRFTDFARAQRRDLAGRAGTREMTYWRRELDGAPFTAQLPVDDPAQPPGSPQSAGQPVGLSLPADLHQGLRTLAREQRATVFMTMLAAYGVLTHRYTGQGDLLLATVVANRNRTELEGMIGCFTKKVPLRLRLGGDPTFVDALSATRAALLGALTHQDLPFEAVVQDTLGAPAAAHGLVPHVALMFQGEAPRRELVLPGLDTTGFETAATARRAHFMADDTDDADDERSPPGGTGGRPWGAGLYLGTFVILSVAESDDALSCVARGAFHGPAVRQLLDTYQTLLADVVADPTRPISELCLLDGPGRAGALADGRGPVVASPTTTLHAALDARAHHAPDAVALRSGGQSLTYAEVGARADRLAGRLQALGVGPGATVGLALGPCADAVVAAFAVWRAGAAWVGLDPEDAGDRLERILALTPIEVVVGADPHAPVARHARWVAVTDDGAPAPAVPARVGPQDAAVVHHATSPGPASRRVVLDHRCLLAVTASLRDLRGGPDVRRVCLSAPPAEEGFVRQLAALLDGHTLCVPDRPLTADPAATVALVDAGQVDVIDCTPGELSALLDAGLEDALERREPGTAEPVLVVATTAALDPEIWDRVRSLSRARPVVVYSPPECAFAATAAAVADHARPVVGHPLPGVAAHVLDSRGRPVPPRALGELHLAGANLAAGGRDGPRESAAPPFVDHVLDGTATRLYRTGQLARRFPDGTVQVLGLLDADTDLRGFSVDPARVQSALAACPGVRDVTVTLHRDDAGDPRLVAHVRPDGRPPTIAALRAWVWARLPGYACPSAVVVVEGDAAPADAAPAPAVDGVAESAVLTALWADVLGAGPVAATENYWQRFSFLEVLAGAREAGLAVTSAQVTRNRTVEMLAADLAAQPPRQP